MPDTHEALQVARSLADFCSVFAANRHTADWHKKRPSLALSGGGGEFDAAAFAI